ncbi:Putative FBD-associated F-box protein [Striga hermonthica]|uniref:FBD-associated F-box protein n=1 Tax=Striga hermonthica TaxID=68872 RepID=A0A9N7R356_STRHE|nr:Putative FBD-associated F-box protein [Striga hermonthica]
MISSVDRLSSLPDDVICHILSFLPTKLSVATSVLGRRWRFLWAHVPCFDFGAKDFTGKTEHSDIIHRFILRHEAKRMNTFRLSLVNCNEYQLETWISVAIKRNILNLDLGLNVFRLILPRPLFTCKTIVDMRIFGGKYVSSSGDIHLPCLKKLVLHLVEFEDDESLPRLLSGCPLLKELTMSYSFILNEKRLGCINISSPSLETLTIDFNNYEDFPVYEILINAKALRYLYMGDCPLGFITNSTTMSSLAEACICFQYGFFVYMNSESYSNVVKFLDCLCNVKCLQISSYGGKEVLPLGFAGSLVKFVNLTKLELQSSAGWHLLVHLLEVADNLEALVIEIELISFTEPNRVPTSLLSSLRTITIKVVCIGEDEFNVVRYLLKNSHVLEEMKILALDDDSIPSDLSEGDLNVAFDALQRISLFERGSVTCQLAFQVVEQLN